VSVLGQVPAVAILAGDSNVMQRGPPFHAVLAAVAQAHREGLDKPTFLPTPSPDPGSHSCGSAVASADWPPARPSRVSLSPRSPASSPDSSGRDGPLTLFREPCTRWAADRYGHSPPTLGASEHRRRRTDPRDLNAAPTGRRNKSGTPTCASSTCGSDPRTSEWRHADPRRSDAPSPHHRTRPTAPGPRQHVAWIVDVNVVRPRCAAGAPR